MNLDMIKVIGAKLISIITALIFLNGGLFAAWFYMVSPMKEDANKELKTLNAKITQLRQKILNIKEEKKYYDENIGKYNALQAKGYMTPQDELQLTQNLNAPYTAHHLINMSYDISSVQKLPSSEIDRTKHELIKRSIELQDIDAYFDTDIFKFIHDVNTKFPGHTRFKSITMTRKEPATFSAALDRIAMGTEEGIMTGNILLDWYAMVPATPIQDDGQPPQR